MNADGSNPINLSNNQASDFSPDWSPEGDKILLLSTRDDQESGRYEIYVMNADGSNPINLTNHTAQDTEPVWSPFPALSSIQPVRLRIRSAFGAPGNTLQAPLILTSDETSAGGLEWQVIRGSDAIAFDSLITHIPSFTATANTIGDTTFMLIHSPTGATIAPGTVTLGTLRYRIAEDAPLCTPFTLTLNAVEIGDSLGFALPDSAVSGEIQAGIPGDLNLDRRVSILDIIKLVRILVAKEPEPDSTTCAFFIADFNGDDDLDVLDVIGQVNTILHISKPVALPVPTTALIRLGAVQTGPSGGLIVPVVVQSDGLIAGLQAIARFDPSAVSVGTPQLTGAASGLSFDTSIQGGALRIVVFGLQPRQGIAAGSGAVLLIPVTLRDGSIEPYFELSEVVVASAQGQRVPVTIGSPGKAAAIPTAFALHAAQPNPFNPFTRIAYEAPQQAHITLIVYNLLGQEVVRLVDAVKAPGRYSVTWDGRNAQGQAVSSGIYLYRLTSDAGFSQTRRMTVLK